jgi:PAS domain S-box-containing protein
MAKKPTYEKLEQRIKELEKAVLERKRTEKPLQEFEQEKEIILKSLVEHVIYQDTEMRILWANRAACESVNMTHEQLFGRFCYEIWPKRSDPCPDCPLKKAMKTRQPEEIEKCTPDGRAWFIRGYPVQDSKGKIVGAIELTLDITGRKQAEQELRNAHDNLAQRVKERTDELLKANQELRRQIDERKRTEQTLQESEENYRHLFQTITDAIMLFDGDTRQFIDVNNAALILYGYRRKEFLKLTHQDITSEPENSDATIRQTLEGKLERIPVRYHKKKNGSIFPVEISTSTFTLRNRKVLCGVIRDITERKRAEKELLEREQIMKAILAASPVGIGLVRNRIIDRSNRAMDRIWGYEEGSLVGKSTKVLYPDAEEYNRVGQEFYSEIEEKGVGNLETRWVTKDGTKIHCFLQGSPLDPSDLSKGVIVAAMDITELKRAEGLVFNLSQMLMQAQEHERQMISRELHDSIAQNLSTLKIGCDLLFDDQPAIPHEIKEKMAKYSNLIDQTISSVRNLAYDLRPPVLDEIGLVKALEIYCDEFSEHSGIKVDFQSAGIHKLNFDSNTEIHLYRLVQEGLNNIRKHAHATRATIKMVGAYPNIILRIEDDGQGFDVKARELKLDKEKRMGLQSMKERVNLLQGRMTIQSRPMKGTKIFITYPFNYKNNSSEKLNMNHG